MNSPVAEPLKPVPVLPPVADGASCISVPPDQMLENATAAAAFLKALAHEGRLMILCYLSTGEKSVTELENLLDSRQAAVRPAGQGRSAVAPP